jgi:hypothetical protein
VRAHRDWAKDQGAVDDFADDAPTQTPPGGFNLG